MDRCLHPVAVVRLLLRGRRRAQQREHPQRSPHLHPARTQRPGEGGAKWRRAPCSLLEQRTATQRPADGANTLRHRQRPAGAPAGDILRPHFEHCSIVDFCTAHVSNVLMTRILPPWAPSPFERSLRGAASACGPTRVGTRVKAKPKAGGSACAEEAPSLGVAPSAGWVSRLIGMPLLLHSYTRTA